VPVAKLPSFKNITITGYWLSVTDFKKFHRPRRLRPLTVTIEDCLRYSSRSLTFATLNSLRYLHINKLFNFQDYEWNVLIKAEYDLYKLSKDSNNFK